MFITAHGGANNTIGNSQEYLNEMSKFKVNAIEVDVRKRGDFIYCHHNFPLSVKDKLPLKDVLEYVKERNIMVNIDMKEKGIIKNIMKLVIELNVENNVYFTGTFTPKDIKFLGACKVYLNDKFFKRKKILTNDIECIANYIKSFKDERLAGINIRYRFATNDFIEECKKHNLKISVYTVDDICELERLTKIDYLDNITTNKITEAMNILNR